MNIFNSDIAVTQIVAAVFVPEGQGTPVHKNRASHGLALCINSSGSVFTFSDGTVLTCCSGDCIFLPQGSSYYVTPNQACYETIQCGNKNGTYAINFKLSGDDVYQPTVVKVNGLDNILVDFIKAENAWRKKESAYREECIISLYRIIRRIKQEQAVTIRKQSEALLPALEYISAHYTDEIISVPFLSELCGVSEQYLRRLFQAEFGYSPAIYIRLLRLEYAKSLLETNEYSVTDIAMLSGFNSPAYFSREFKKEYGVSPKAFNGI